MSLPGWRCFVRAATRSCGQHRGCWEELTRTPGPSRAVSYVFPVADLNLYPFAGMNPNRDHSGITEFCESLKQIIEPEGGFRGHQSQSVATTLCSSVKRFVDFYTVKPLPIGFSFLGLP